MERATKAATFAVVWVLPIFTLHWILNPKGTWLKTVNTFQLKVNKKLLSRAHACLLVRMSMGNILCHEWKNTFSSFFEHINLWHFKQKLHVGRKVTLIGLNLCIICRYELSPTSNFQELMYFSQHHRNYECKWRKANLIAHSVWHGIVFSDCLLCQK